MDVINSHTRKAISQIALRSFFEIQRKWRLGRSEAMALLGLTATSTYANWKNACSTILPRDTLERISYLITLDKKLTSIGETHVKQWLRQTDYQPGTSIFDKMIEGDVVDLFKALEHVKQTTNQTYHDRAV